MVPGETHLPPQQMARSPHGMAQMPQLALSNMVSTHWSPQAVRLGVQLRAHLPPMQICPGPHGMPQPPQLARSTLVSTQTSPQLASAPGQPHAPSMQASAAGQTWPQLPQFLASAATGMHAPLQAICPLGQVIPAEFGQPALPRHTTRHASVAQTPRAVGAFIGPPLCSRIRSSGAAIFSEAVTAVKARACGDLPQAVRPVISIETKAL
jgi:hypothetical protein